MAEMLYRKRGKRYAPEPELSALAPFDAVRNEHCQPPTFKPAALNYRVTADGQTHGRCVAAAARAMIAPLKLKGGEE